MTKSSGVRSAAQETLGSLAAMVRRHQASTAAEIIATLHDSGAGRLLRPAPYGGLEVDAEEFVSLIGDLAALDGSAGWLCAMFNVAAYDVSSLPERAVNDVWGADANALIAPCYSAGGLLAQTTGDRMLSGRWQFVAGGEYADWFLLTADADGTPHCVLVPRSAVHIEPAQHPTGLDAAGIRDVTVTDVPVEQRQIFQNAVERAQFAPRIATRMLAGAAAAAVVVGAAGGVWRTFVEQMRERLAASYGSEELTDQTSTTVHVARAASDIDAARLQIEASFRPGRDGVRDTFRAAAWAHRQAAVRARDAADQLLGASHRHALDASDQVTRLWRDVHAACRLTIFLLDGLDSG
ncbi:hypothetical protein [Mycobacterium sp. IS-1556]|uniref:hypothetical protein n=1 Tax=Mycobacterium sp. IS-1556 TaxID=1772276 RepID=UPI0007415C56|nr:hypothetical protein [Mycobacterium sp. IS-1556]KUH85508.1 hypothetical protein AU186_22375 [Mycobacterium sp. GA-1999]KUH96379.1 hypothetical protein AU187_14405 [Mycobacterium sp. IS-1556]